MNTRLREGEDILRESAANLQRGFETAGGFLYLTNQRLIFEAHRFNAQDGATVIPLRDVEGAWKCWTKLFGLIPLAPNSLAVATTKGPVYKFVLFGRDEWMRAIRYAKDDLADANNR